MAKLQSRDNFKPAQVKQTERADPLPKTFGDAFLQARRAHGGDGGTFEWQGKSYSTNVAGSKTTTPKSAPVTYKPKKELGEVTVTTKPEKGATVSSVMDMQKMNVDAEAGKLKKTSSSQKSGMVTTLDKRKNFENKLNTGLAILGTTAAVGSMIFASRNNPSKAVQVIDKTGKLPGVLGGVVKAVTKNTGTMEAATKNMAKVSGRVRNIAKTPKAGTATPSAAKAAPTSRTPAVTAKPAPAPKKKTSTKKK